MKSVIQLETQEGGLVYLNPGLVASVADVEGAVVPLAHVTSAGGACWRVKGGSREIAAHIFGEVMDNGRRAVKVVRPGHASRVEAVPTTARCDPDALLG